MPQYERCAVSPLHVVSDHATSAVPRPQTCGAVGLSWHVTFSALYRQVRCQVEDVPILGKVFQGSPLDPDPGSAASQCAPVRTHAVTREIHWRSPTLADLH